MPVFVYDVEGWAWWHKARALAQEFGWATKCVQERDCGSIANIGAQTVFFSPQQFARVVQEWDAEFVREHVFVGASFPAELPALAELAPKVAGIFVNNRRMHDALAAIDVDAWLIPNGVDCAFWCPPEPDTRTSRTGPLRVGWVGNSRHHTHGGRAPHKGFQIVAEACARSGAILIAKDTAGDYSGDSYWAPMVLRDRIYRQIDVLAVASEMEGTPNPALEAMACGVPVVTTPVGDAADMIQLHGGGWIVDRCVESFALMFGGLTREKCAEIGKQATNVVGMCRKWSRAADRMREMFAAAAAAAEQRRGVAP